MAQRNIYNDEIFFEGYKKIRDNKINAKNLFEIPTLFSMLPDLKNKRILDLGCGFGEHCKRFIECGAKRVVGIDISEKIFEVARNENSDPNIIYINMLDTEGIFIFSQENPLCTCHSGGNRWTRDEQGNKIHLNLSDYGIEGERESVWFVDNVKKYHRTFSTIINTLINSGFSIERMIEPLPTDEILEQYPDYKDLFHKPDFLLLRVKK